MNKNELSMMIRAGLGNAEAKQQLIEIYEDKLQTNTGIFVVLALIFIASLYYDFTGGILYWFVVLFTAGNRTYLSNQLKRIKEIP